MVYDRDDMATGIAAGLRAVARQGVGPGTRLVAIGSPDPLHLSRQLFAAFQAGRGHAGRYGRHAAARARARARRLPARGDRRLSDGRRAARRRAARGPSAHRAAHPRVRLGADDGRHPRPPRRRVGRPPRERLRHDGGADRRRELAARTGTSTWPRTCSCSRSSTPPGGRSRTASPAPAILVDEPREPRAAAHPLRDRRRRHDRARPGPGRPPVSAPRLGRGPQRRPAPPPRRRRRDRRVHPFRLGRPLPRSPTCAGSSSPRGRGDRRRGRAAPGRRPRRARSPARGDRRRARGGGRGGPARRRRGGGAIARESGPGAKLKLVRGPR